MCANELKLIRVIRELREHYDFRYNIIQNIIEVKPKEHLEYAEANENDLVIELQTRKIAASNNDVITFLKSNKIVRYDPFQEYFIACHKKYLEYNQTDYIRKFLDYVKTEDQYRFIVQFMKWACRVVKCALCENYFNKNAIVLVSSGKQNLGKSSFTRFLVPSQFKSYYIENPRLGNDMDIALSANLLCILDDLGNMRNTDLEEFKSSMSRLHVNVRRPYAANPKMTPRRISFIGTTDTYSFLTTDATVRWICFDVTDIDWSYSKEIDIDLVWGEAYDLYINGFDCEVSKDEIDQNERYNSKFKTHSIEYEMLSKYYAPGSEDDHHDILMSSEILLDLQNKTYQKYSDKKIGQALRSLGFVAVNRRNHINTQGDTITDSRRVYFIKYLLTT